MKTLIKKVCFAVMLVMLSLTACTSASAESIDDVLKDCKLDRSNWKIVEWFKAEQFVRFYDSTSVTVTGPGQFDAMICDYFYGNACRQENCALRGTKHYHTEKWGFNTAQSAGTLRAFSLKDAGYNTVDAYDYPTSLQIASELTKKSIEEKAMLKIKDSLKDDKKFAAEPKATADSKDTAPQPKIKGLVPMPLTIGASDGEWTYLGRFIAPANFNSLFEWETKMKRYIGNAESNNLYDVYYYHSHYGTGDGEGCLMVDSSNGPWHFGFSCVIKCVPLDQNARPKKLSGINNGIFLLSMNGGCKGAFSAVIGRVRVFDSSTHQLLTDETSRQNPKLNGNFRDYDYNVTQYRENSPFYIAMRMTTSCPIKPFPIP